MTCKETSYVTRSEKWVNETALKALAELERLKEERDKKLRQETIDLMTKPYEGFWDWFAGHKRYKLEDCTEKAIRAFAWEYMLPYAWSNCKYQNGIDAVCRLIEATNPTTNTTWVQLTLSDSALLERYS